MTTLIIVAFAVGLDNMGAAIGIGMGGVGRRLRLRIATIFGSFEAAMPILGILVGRTVADALGRNGASRAAGVLLGSIGAYSMVVAAVRGQRARSISGSGTWRLVLIGVALSIDNLVIGFALGSYHVNLVVAVIVIALVSTCLSVLGLELGSRLGLRVGERSELLGGAILVVVGIAVGTGLL